MSFIKSVFLGSEGNYKVWGLDISFKKDYPSGEKPSRLSKISDRVFGIVCQQYLYTLIHEVGHAIAYRLLENRSSKINIFRNADGEHCAFLCSSIKKQSIALAAGSLTNTAFAGIMLTSSIALRRAFPLLSMWYGCSAYYSIADELFNSIASAYQRDDGDFGRLVRQPLTHLAAASAAQIGLIALAHFGAYKAI